MEENVKFSAFGSLRATESKIVDVDEIVRLIKYDDGIAKKTALYRQMAQNVSRETAKKEVKEKAMPAFSVGVVFKSYGRQLPDVAYATGFALCDIDMTPSNSSCLGGEQEREEIRRKICQDPHTFLCYQTISGQGFRIIYRYEREGHHPVNCEAYPAAFKKGNEYYQALTGCEYDRACGDAVRLSGLAHDKEVYYQPDSKSFVISDEEFLTESMTNNAEERGRPRKDYDPNTYHANVEQAWTVIERMLNNQQRFYAEHYRHDFILHATYLFNRFGTSEEELKEWAAQQWGDLPDKERNDVIHHRYKNKALHGTWKLNNAPGKGRKNSLLSTTEIRTWLTERCQVCYNVVTDQTMYRRLKVKDERLKVNEEYELITDRVVESMRCQMEADTGKRVLTKDVLSVLNSDFSILSHPVREYINQLAAWDGTDRVHELASHLVAEPVTDHQTAEEAQRDIEWALHKWLVAMVATWLDDRLANHQVLTLIGEQGIYKSTFFRHLLPTPLRGYFWENAHNSFSAKDDKLAIAENCLVEIEEIEATEGRQMAELKALVTAESINERRPYALFRKQKARLASFCASGNEQRFLTDQTGNRRWLCFKVSHIDDPRQWNLDYDQLYAQLRDEYLQGFQFWFDKEEEQRVERLNEPFRLASIEEQLISHRLRKPKNGEVPKKMNASMISVFLGGGHLSSQISARKIANIMRKMGFKWKHHRDGDYYYVVEIGLNEVQHYLSDNEQLEAPF
ncbi:MAG: hypothetical protein J5952_07135 [Prevotella sp.]|nr:hypothetical protein [Prevotella sp.]